MPYFWAGLKVYDVISGRQLLKPSYLLSKNTALEEFPMLKSDKLCGAIVYYDGEWDYVYCKYSKNGKSKVLKLAAILPQHAQKIDLLADSKVLQNLYFCKGSTPGYCVMAICIS